MTQEATHHPSGTLTIAVGLAVVAGFVDAHVYLNVTPVFVANMSGNLIHLGIVVGNGAVRQALAALAALGSFVTGVMAATWHHDRQLRRTGPLRPGPLLAAEAVLLGVLPVLRWVFDIPYARHAGVGQYAVICTAALAMGLQTAALRRVGQVAVATTYGTGAIVRLGEKVALAMRRVGHTSGARRRVTIGVLSAVLAGYVGGAVLATVLGSEPWLLLLPAVALAVLAAISVESARQEVAEVG